MYKKYWGLEKCGVQKISRVEITGNLGIGFFFIWWSHHHPVQMFVVSRHFECISCICITIEFGCYLKVHLDQFCIEYPTQFETQIGPGVKMSLNWRWFFGTLPLHVELAKILVVHSQKKGMRLSRKLPKSTPKKKTFSWYLIKNDWSLWIEKLAKKPDDLHRNWNVQKIVGVTLLQWFITKLLPRSFLGIWWFFKLHFCKHICCRIMNMSGSGSMDLIQSQSKIRSKIARFF